MDLIKTGIGISKTFKNVARLREVVGVLYRNGFTELLSKTNLLEKVPGFVIPKNVEPTPEEIMNAVWSKQIGYRLRKSFEELGPSFVKIGQLLSTREDIFPPEFIEQMKILQDQAKPFPFLEAKDALEKSFGKKIEEVFKTIDQVPIGMASIGVVYKATLLSGEEVVVKVRRPKIDKIVEQDFELLTFLIKQVEKVSDEIKYLGLSKVLDDFSKSLAYELDFRIEATNAERLKANVSKIDREGLFHLPKIYKELSSENVMVMEFIKGTPFNKITPNHPQIELIYTCLIKSVHVFVHTLLIDGFFHADLHGGNFFLMEDNKIGIIDFGLMGTLGKKSRENLIAILYSLTSFNYENLVYEFLDVAEYEQIPDIDGLVRDIKDSLVPYVGLSVKDTNFSALLKALVGTLSRHQIYLPREWFIIFRGLIAIDGVGKAINIDLNIYEILNKDIEGLVKNMLSKEAATEEAIWAGRDVINSLRMFPRHMRWFMREWSKRNYAFEIKITGHESAFRHLSASINFLGINVTSGLLIIAGTMLVDRSKGLITIDSVPGISWFFWILSAFLFVNSLWRIRKVK
ncbi:MAG: ABC1 kinase family protein [Bacteriovoracaceae bacterium]